MDLSMQIHSGIRQEQNLSAQTLQSVQLLQMTTHELEVAIEKELSENPLLEMDAPSDSSNEEEKRIESDTENENPLNEFSADDFPKDY